MISLTAHQPVYLPWLGFFHKISMADEYVCYDHVQISNRDFTAKNSIKTADGKLQLNVPLSKKKSKSQALKDILIDNSQAWARQHKKAIQTNYQKAEFFDRYYPEIERALDKEWTFIRDLNSEVTRLCLEWLEIPREIKYSSDLGVKGYKNDGILEMCQIMGANRIVFGVHGNSYVDTDLFQKNGIDCFFQDYKHPEYTQKFKEFVPYLSVVDLLFNEGPKSLEIIKRGNQHPV